MRVIGLKNAVYNEKGWRYLLFYDIDGDSTDIRLTLKGYREFERTSWILYTTKHGQHLVGLSPIGSYTWGYLHQCLQNDNPAFYSGQTIRLSRKPNESQQLLEYYIAPDYPPIERLWNIYARRFGISYRPDRFDPDGYRLVFETYKTKKE